MNDYSKDTDKLNGEKMEIAIVVKILLQKIIYEDLSGRGVHKSTSHAQGGHGFSHAFCTCMRIFMCDSLYYAEC